MSGCSGTLAVGALLGEACASELAHRVDDQLHGNVLTKDVEVLDELELGAGLVRRTKDVDQETTSEETAEDTISLDFRLVQAAGLCAATVLVGALLDAGTAGRGSLRDGSHTEGEGEGSDNSGEVHCDVGKESGRFQRELRRQVIHVKEIR